MNRTSKLSKVRFECNSPSDTALTSFKRGRIWIDDEEVSSRVFGISVTGGVDEVAKVWIGFYPGQIELEIEGIENEFKPVKSSV